MSALTVKYIPVCRNNDHFAVYVQHANGHVIGMMVASLCEWCTKVNRSLIGPLQDEAETVRGVGKSSDYEK